jgi:ferritin-like metal-binding protein YciE
MATATASKTEEILIDWLRDAHAMEKHAEQVLSSTASRIENYPELKTQLERHAEQTRRQADLIRECLDRHDGGTSTMKDTAGRVMGFAQAMSGMFVGDEIIKASMGSYVFEHMEIAAYKTLIAAAKECDDQQTKRVCETILHEEEAMARRLDERLPEITRKYLARSEQDVTAKH